MIIGVWGDSITYGEHDSEGLGWVGRLRKSFAPKFTTRVYNFGVCGDTSSDAVRRFGVESQSIRPEIVYFALGMNDCKYPINTKKNLVDIEEFENNLKKLIIAARKYTDTIIIIGLTKINQDLPRSSKFRRDNETIEVYNDSLRKFCETENVSFVDVFGSLDIHKDLADGVHPNTNGYEKLFAVIYAYVRPIYDQMRM